MEELTTQVLGVVGDFVVQILTNPFNLAILFGTYGIIYALKPAAHAFAWSEFVGRARVGLYHTFNWGKRMAATMWCSIAVWIPALQPKLCGPEPIEGCQTVSMRITTGITLGVLLTVGYAKVMARLEGGGPKPKFKVKCRQPKCKKTSRVDDLQQPCPECNDSLHELVKVKS